MRASRGFTLIEALLTLAVAAVLATLAVPSYGDFAARHRLLAVSETMAQDLGLARFEAAQRGAPVHVVGHAGPAWCYAVATSPDCDCRTPQAACVLHRVGAEDHPGIRLLDARAVTFDPAGVQATGTRAARWQHGERWATEVHVHPAGRSRVCAAGPPMRGVAACGG